MNFHVDFNSGKNSFSLQLWAGHSVLSYTADDPVKNKKDKPRPPTRKPGEESRKKSVEDVKG